MSGPALTRRARRALILVEVAAIATGTAAGFAAHGKHPLIAIAVAALAAFFALAAIAAALTPEA